MTRHRPDGDEAGPTPTWSCRWEPSLEPADHPALAELLTRSFPATAAFARGCSWAGARPELRIIGCLDDRPVAHAGVIRRFLRSPDQHAETLVGDVGLIAVHPGYQGRHLGVALMTTVAATLARLRLPYGFLTCGPDLVSFYERCGRTALPDQPLRSINIRHQVENHRSNGVLLPVLAPAGPWPSGPVHRDGQEI